MKLTKKILLALGVIAAAGASYAQTTAAGAPVGVLGQRYTDFSFGLQDIRHYSDHAYDVTASANLPLAPNVDLSGSYSYAWFRGPAAAHANTFAGAATVYAPMSGVKPFATAALGYQWLKGTSSSEVPLWAGGVGVEIPVGTFSLTPRLTYQDDFRGNPKSTQQVVYEVEGNLWLNSTSAVYATVAKIDVQHSPADAWGYRVGVRMKF